MADCITATDLWKTHVRRGVFGRTRVTALKGVSVSVAAGKTLGIVGESGAGKSTLARALLYLDPPDTGTVTVGGVNLGRISRRELRLMRPRLGIVFQDPNSSLNPRLTVGTSIEEALLPRLRRRAARRERVGELLSHVGLAPGDQDRLPHEFSGGQRQRIGIARALAAGPELLVLDEPVSSLDVSIQAQILNLLLDLKDELDLTYLFISHDLNVVAFLSDEIAVMNDGRIVEQGPTERLLHAPSDPYTKQLFEDTPVFHDRRLRYNGDRRSER
ncbi:MAG: ATP-binding cassette domain-containing protein [Spirochaetaceae bacterium]